MLPSLLKRTPSIDLKCRFIEPTVIASSLLHPIKTLWPIDATLSGISIDDNELQCEKVELPIDVTLFESVIDDNDLQNEKALLPIDATLFGSVMIVKCEFFELTVITFQGYLQLI